MEIKAVVVQSDCVRKKHHYFFFDSQGILAQFATHKDGSFICGLDLADTLSWVSAQPACRAEATTGRAVEQFAKISSSAVWYIWLLTRGGGLAYYPHTTTTSYLEKKRKINMKIMEISSFVLAAAPLSVLLMKISASHTTGNFVEHYSEIHDSDIPVQGK